MRWKALLLGLISSIGCGDMGGGYGGDFGATPGGVKDLTLARELIAAGKVPPADALLVEAMFSEHDLALEGAPCASTLCLRAAAGFAPEHDEAPRGFAQVGLSSTIDPATWQRPSTTFIFTVDVSGSMGWGSDVSPGELSRSLLHKLTDELREDDRVALVTYGSDIETKLELTAGTQLARVHDAIDDLSEAGSTNMEGGMRRAYALGDDALGSTEQVRVIVFTDVQPNVGATGASEFNTLVSDAASNDVHTTVLALGTGIGPEVMRGMASLRGANAFSMTDEEDVEQFIADEYPWFTTPVAYGLRVNVQLDNGWSVDRGLGFPAASDEEQIGLKAETVFLSKRKGALLAAFTPPAETTTPAGLAGAFDLAYTERDGTEVHTTAPFAYDNSALDERGQWFAQRGVARTTALGLLTEAMHDAAVVYNESPEAAEEIMRTAHTRYLGDAEALGDADLAVEADLSGALLQLIVDRAAQGTLYGL